MTKKISVLVLLTISCLQGLAQIDTTFLFKRQKGFLFLTNYNYQYDYLEGHEVRPLGFHDFFFPTDSFDMESILHNVEKVNFKNGIRIDFIENRKVIKNQAYVVKCEDTSRCYAFEQFYIVPVVLEYKKIKEYEPLVCNKNYFDIIVRDGSALHFEYLHEAIKPTKIVITKVTTKIKKKKLKK